MERMDPIEIAEDDTGVLVEDFVKALRIGNLRTTLRAIDKYGDYTLLLELTNGVTLHPGDGDDVDPTQGVAALVATGIAWDWTDWEYYWRVEVNEKTDLAALHEDMGAAFNEALDDHNELDFLENNH